MPVSCVDADLGYLHAVSVHHVDDSLRVGRLRHTVPRILKEVLRGMVRELFSTLVAGQLPRRSN